MNIWYRHHVSPHAVESTPPYNTCINATKAAGPCYVHNS
jgi:hypothetical protein